MNNCNLENFGLDIFIDNGDCEHCPFKNKSECAKAWDELTTRVLLDCYAQKIIDQKVGRKLTIKETEIVANTFKRNEIKHLLKHMGVKLA